MRSKPSKGARKMSMLAIVATFFRIRGRITRSEWLSRLIMAALFCSAFGGLFGHFFGDFGSGSFAVLFIGCAIALAVRRLHDVDRSGLAVAAAIVPVIGPIWLFIQLLRRGVAHENRYGVDPASHADYLKVDIAR
ncbi:DUF805 domain-containing protein [Dyella flagellata]|uniref:DUF805 domain-containing protein n=1 Tax=Dyella flagellata TaxID=1867833 RepID=UPI00383DB72D